MPKKPQPTWYKWVIVIACAMLFACAAGISFGLVPLFIKPMAAALELPRTATTLMVTVMSLGSMITAPLTGPLARRMGIRRMMILGAILTSCGLLFLPLFKSILLIYPFCFLYGASACLIGLFPCQTLLINWFGSKRGTATGIMLSGSGVLTTVLSPYMSRMIETSGWQAGFRFLGILCLCLSLFAVLVLVRERPAIPVLDEAPTATGEMPGATFQQARRSSSFALICAAGFLCTILGCTVASHIASYLSDVGHTTAQAASFNSVFALCSIPGKILLGIFYDRMGLRRGNLLICSVFFAGIVLFLFAGSYPLALVSSALLGAANGIQQMPAPLLVNFSFGRREYDNIYGTVGSALLLGSVLGPPAASIIFDWLGSYRVAWILWAVLTVVLFGLFTLILKKGPIYSADRSGEKTKQEAES